MVEASTSCTVSIKSDSEFTEILKKIKEETDTFMDFPIAGVNFYDFFSLLYKPEIRHVALEACIYGVEKHKTGEFNAVAGLDSRGFIVGLVLAEHFKIPFIPIRKKGKLPGICVEEKFTKEYGEDVFQIQKHAVDSNSHILIADDLLATGGSMKACEALIEKCGGKVVNSFVIYNLKFLNGRDKLKYPDKLITLLDLDE
jgi:adenine phosphoribosyltransferase